VPIPPSTFAKGLRQAADRLEGARLDRDQDNAIQALADWMNWAMPIDEQLNDTYKADYQSLRAADSSGRALPGVRHAWNLHKHQGHRIRSLVVISEGMAFPVRFDLPFFEIRWRQFDDLPLPPDEHRSPNQEAVYRDQLQGQPVRMLAPGMTTFLLTAEATLLLPL
jgi:hypothetical protein